MGALPGYVDSVYSINLLQHIQRTTIVRKYSDTVLLQPASLTFPILYALDIPFLQCFHINLCAEHMLQSPVGQAVISMFQRSWQATVYT